MSEPRRILVVDDQEDIREMTSLALSGAGYGVETAGSGSQALDQLLDGRFDLVLLDINMPGMDGWETLNLIRCDDELADTPVVMFSVRSELRDRAQGLQDGALDYIAKPFVVDELLARLERIFDELQPQRIDEPTGGESA